MSFSKTPRRRQLPSSFISYLTAGLETGAKAEADATKAAKQKAVFMVDLVLSGITD
jgi:hypothetical protein